jgi:hypothetical protein
VPTEMARADLIEVLRLRLLICRAAASDSMRWWDDESLTEDGMFVLGRLFPRSAQTAARRLALEAALVRHQAALADIPHAQHLFDLGPAVEAAIEELPLSTINIPTGPIRDSQALLALIGGETLGPTDHSQGLVVRVTLPAAYASLKERAWALAQAYAAGRPGEPVFPILETGERE